MTTTIDARGLSCPQPVLLTLEAIKKRPKANLPFLWTLTPPKKMSCAPPSVRAGRRPGYGSRPENIRLF